MCYYGSGNHVNILYRAQFSFESHTNLVKASNDLVQQSEAVHSFMFELFLLKVLIKPSDGGKHNTHFIIGLGVKLLNGKLCHTHSS